MKLADLFIKLGLKSDDYKKGIDQAQQKTNAFTAGLKKIGGMIAGAFAAQKIVAFTSELVKLGGEAQGVRAAFNRIADDKILDGLKNAVKGTVSELELMKRAVSASNLGIPVENLAKLFEFATKRAQDTGESVDYLVNSIVTGIGRKSPLILDNLGISAVQLKEKLHGVGMETASVAQIAKAVGDIAADAMRESGDIIDSNAIKIQRLGTIWQDFKLRVAESKAVIDSISDSLTKTEQMLYVWSSNNATRLEKWAIALELFDKRAERLYNQVKKRDEAEAARAAAFKDATKYEDNAYRNKIEYELGVGDATKKHIKTIGDLKTEIEELKASLDLYGISQTGEIQKTLREIDAKEKLIKTLTTLKTKREDTSYFTSMTGQAGTPKIGDTMAPMPAGLGDMTGFLAKNAEMTKKYTAEMLADWNNFTTDLGHLVNDGIINFIDEFAYSLGQLASGNINLKGFFNNILNQLSQFLGQIGKLMIAFGVAQLAFGESLKNIFNPASAPILIAAGAALVAISGAIGGMASKAAGGGGMSAGAGGGINIKTVDKYDQQQELVARVSGRDLEFVLQQRSNFKNKL